MFYAFLVMCIVFAVRGCKNKYGRCARADRDLSADVVVHAYNNGCVRLWNKRTKRHTTPRLDWVSGIPGRDSLTVFCDKIGRHGFLNAYTGKIVIPAQYAKVWHFFEDVAAVMGGNGKWGFIDKEGKEVIPFKYDDVFPFSKGLAKVKFDGKWGFIDKEGKEIIPCKNDDVFPFSEGLARVSMRFPVFP